MKINIIVNQNDVDSSTDSNILSFMFRKIKNKTDIKMVDVNNFKCDNASINIFCSTFNFALTNYAKTNILLPSQTSFNKEWLKYINHIDYVLCKTRYIETLFTNYISKNKIKYVGWRSSDLKNSYDKDYEKYLLYCCDTKHTDYNKIIDNWDVSYPELNIINGHLFNTQKKQDNLVYHGNIKQNVFENIFNECGIHICLNSIDSFSHNVNQACLSKSIPILLNVDPMKEIVNDDISFMINTNKKTKLKTGMGSKYDYDIDELHYLINKIKNTSETTLEIMGENARKHCVRNHAMNDDLLKKCFNQIIKDTREIKKSVSQIKEEDLPKVSIITLTHNRKHMFKLAIYNFNTCKYPKDKLEWVIYDTSNDENKVENLLPNEEDRAKININYRHNNILESIGVSRKNAVAQASHDVIVFMDDDDYYYPDNVIKRVTALETNNVDIVGCTYLGSMCINSIVSYINAPSINDKLGTKISPASLCFRKKILNESCFFDDENINECETIFNKLNYSKFKEIPWENIIVALSHKSNITNRNVPKTKANGCFYKFSDKLLKFILELDD